MEFPYIESISYSEFITRALLSVICGGLVGLERQLAGKPVGLRTCSLVCLATQAFVFLGAQLSGPAMDPSRVVGQVVTGVGFLGAGAILAKKGELRGITTATVIWVLAAIGCYIGIGYYLQAILLSLTTVFILIVIKMVENLIRTDLEGEEDD